MNWVDDVIGFWFDTLRPAEWWSADAALDRTIDERFGALHRRLAGASPLPAPPDAVGHLATVLVLDQFSRHLHRGTAAAFANDVAALAVALDAIDRGFDAALVPARCHFLYMPLMHSEDATIQQRSIERFERLGLPHAMRSARDHFATIARFGRFPARNAALGRPSTDAEIAWLASRRRTSAAGG